jgi:hypothetical protein
MSILETVILIALVALIAYYLGRMSVIWGLAQLLIEHDPQMAKQLQNLEQDQTQEELLRLEQQNGQWYCWGPDQQFLAQASDLDSLFAVLRDRFPNRPFHVSSEGYSQSDFLEIRQSLLRVYTVKDQLQ